MFNSYKNHLAHFNQSVWAMLIGGFVVRVTYFMSWPFLIIVLNQQSRVSTLGVGVILGFSAGVSALSGLYIGYLSDKFGRKPLILIGCLIAFCCYAALIYTRDFWYLFVIMALLGFVRPMVEVTTKSILCDNIAHKPAREFSLYFRYFLINVAGALGPLIALWLGVEHTGILFTITSTTYLCYFLWIAKLIPNTRHSTQAQAPNFLQTVSVIGKDQRFLLFVIALFLISLVYSQANATLPQILTQALGDDAATLFALLTVVNCLTVVTLQFPLLKLLQKIALAKRTQLGILFLLLSQLMFLFTDSYDTLIWCAIFFVFSVGEVIAMPTLSVHIDNIAKPELRGSYFGAAALADLGGAVGPVFGAFIIAHYTDSHYFSLTMLFCAISLLIYRFIVKQQAK